MEIKYQINFFLNVPSIHQAPLISELCNYENINVNVYYERDLSETRLNQGWVTPSFGDAKLQHISKLKIDHELLSSKTINIYSGLKSYKLIHCAFKSIVNSIDNESKNYIQMEKVKYSFLTYTPKIIKYRIMAILYGRKINGILYKGGREFLEKCNLYPLVSTAYYVNAPKKTSLRQSKGTKVKIVYLGSLSKNKRILDFVKIFRNLDQSKYLLDIYGPELDVSLSELKESKGNNVKLCTSIPNNEVYEVLSQYDYLVLPSKKEGWGVVVSEALAVGTKVLVTKSAGICDYIQSEEIVGAEIIDFDDKAAVLDKLSSISKGNIEERSKIISSSYKFLAKFGAEKFISEVCK